MENKLPAGHARSRAEKAFLERLTEHAWQEAQDQQNRRVHDLVAACAADGMLAVLKTTASFVHTQGQSGLGWGINILAKQLVDGQLSRIAIPTLFEPLTARSPLTIA